MPDLPAILHAIREGPDDGERRAALAGWLWENGPDDEAVEAGVSLDETLRAVAFHATTLGRRVT